MSSRKEKERRKTPVATEEVSVLDEEGQTIAQSLGPQLGTDSNILGEGEFDMRLLSIVDKFERAGLVYFSLRKNRVWQRFYKQFLTLSVSLDGRGRRQLIEMQSAAMGAPRPPVIMDPGWFGRNVTRRNWRRAEEERRQE